MRPELERERDATIATWRKFLIELLGRDEPHLGEQVDKWKGWMESDYDDLGGWFYHDTPLSYVVHLLIPESLRGRLHVHDKERLCYELELAVTHPGGYHHPDQVPNLDWQEVRSRVRDVLENTSGRSVYRYGHEFLGARLARTERRDSSRLRRYMAVENGGRVLVGRSHPLSRSMRATTAAGGREPRSVAPSAG